jgi:hypothetical protein
MYRKKFLVVTGLSTIILFIVLRFINVYGDPSYGQNNLQASGLFFLLSIQVSTRRPYSLWHDIGPHYYCCLVG